MLREAFLTVKSRSYGYFLVTRMGGDGVKKTGGVEESRDRVKVRRRWVAFAHMCGVIHLLSKPDGLLAGWHLFCLTLAGAD